MRLFVALDIPASVRTALDQYVDEMRRIAPDLKWVRPESYHVTVKFIGEWKRDVREMLAALEKIEAKPIHIAFRTSGFFPMPTPRGCFGPESKPTPTSRHLQTLSKALVPH